MSNVKTPLALAIGAALSVGGMTVAPATQADSNPFGLSELKSGYMNVSAVQEVSGEVKEAAAEGKKGEEGKCGEGKCGGAKDAAGEGEKGTEGKCGEGKCGGDKKEADKGKEGKCGEGKCGGAK